MPEFVTTVPGVKILSECNLRQHWSERRKRSKAQQHHTNTALQLFGRDAHKAVIAAPAIAVRLVRLGGRKIDSDNLAGGFKAVRDQIAKWCGRDDGSETYQWEYGQEAAPVPGFRIEVRTP